MVAAFVWIAALAPSALAASPERGRAVFQEKCVACHTIGEGDRVGPDLAGVTARRDGAWLTRWIAAPDRMLGANDPIATELLRQYRNVPMPNQGLTAEEVAAVVAYLGAPAAAATAGAAPLPPGDAAAGRELFTGARPLANGGPACIACHSIAGLGALGGGALGPDLTTAAAKFGTGLASVLAAVPFPTMMPIFGRRPLTPDEQAHLQAFIAGAAVTERAPDALGRLALLAVIGSGVVFGIVHLRWRHRLGGVRARMVDAARTRVLDARAATSRRP
jgi:mono/diheme cytochrome c family protein